MPKKKILIYGAIARSAVHSLVPGATDWKGHLKAARDRLLWAANSTAQLDYRNYDLASPTNLGDVAIAEAIRNQFRFEMDDEPEFTSLNWGEINQIDAEKLHSGFDLVVVSGGGYFQFYDQGALNARVEQDLKFFEKIAIPIVAYGVGTNRPIESDGDSVPRDLGPGDETLLRRILARMSIIGVRSEPSRQTLARYTDKDVRLVCDPALFLDPESHHQPRMHAGAPRVGVNFSFHGPLTTRLLKRNLSAYVAILRDLHGETGCSFHYFIHNHTEWIIPLLLRDKGLKVEIVSGDSYSMVRRYAEMNVQLGGMLHSGVLAAGAGTPCVLLAYDVKQNGFAQLFGWEAHCHRAVDLDPDAVLHSLTLMLENEVEVRDRLRSRLGQLWSEQERFLRDCVALA